MSSSIDHLLASRGIRPVLFDIGASGAPPAIWQDIGRHSIYVGFDPDERDLLDTHGQLFHRAELIREAVTVDATSAEVVFHLTTSPHCSSTLRPDHAALGDYLFSHLFTEEREVAVPATTLNEIVRRLGLQGIDWFKADSQGTDLRLFESLSPTIRAGVLALDIEPGLIDAYVGEDLFVDAHKTLVRSGFWLSRLDVKGSVRMRRSSLDVVQAEHPWMLESAISRANRQSPGWCEGRYLRTVDWLAQHEADERQYLVLWVFGLLDDQPGFALDLAVDYERRFGRGEVSALLKREPIERLQRAIGRPPRPSMMNRIRRRLSRLISRG